MDDISKAIIYSLKTFKVAIAIDVGSKVVILNPHILEHVPLEEIAKVLSSSELTDAEIIEGLKAVDEATKPPFTTSKKP